VKNQLIQMLAMTALLKLDAAGLTVHMLFSRSLTAQVSHSAKLPAVFRVRRRRMSVFN